jgi:tRNA-dihydrouridine synthase B
MKIASKTTSLELGRILLAPLSGVADSPFRRVCKRFGADTVYSEMVSSEGLTRANQRTREVLRFTDEERPIGIQLFGRDPERMAESARQVEALGADFIDINFSCPARKIVSRGAGCALMRDPETVRKISSAVVNATRLPVTGKIRIGWDDDSINAVEIGSVLEDSGILALSVHGRTAKQGFSGTSSWEEVARVKKSAGIPVILSGDVTSPEGASRAFEETGCDAIMIGRGVYGRPWIFRSMHDHFSGRAWRDPDHEERERTVLAHLDLSILEYGERLAVVRFRKHLLWYTKSLPGVVALRPGMSRVVSRQEVVKILERLYSALKEGGGRNG